MDRTTAKSMVIKSAIKFGVNRVDNAVTIEMKSQLSWCVSMAKHLVRKGEGKPHGTPVQSVYNLKDLYALDKKIRGVYALAQNVSHDQMQHVVEQLSKAHKHLIRNMGYVSDGTADAANMASYLGAVAQFLEYAQTGLRSVR